MEYIMEDSWVKQIQYHVMLDVLIGCYLVMIHRTFWIYMAVNYGTAVVNITKKFIFIYLFIYLYHTHSKE